MIKITHPIILTKQFSICKLHQLPNPLPVTHIPPILMNPFQYGFICRAKCHLQWRIYLCLLFPVSLLSMSICNFSDHLTPSHHFRSWTRNKAFGLPVSRSLENTKGIKNTEHSGRPVFYERYQNPTQIQKGINSFALMSTHLVSSPGTSTLDCTRAENP